MRFFVPAFSAAILTFIAIAFVNVTYEQYAQGDGSLIGLMFAAVYLFGAAINVFMASKEWTP